MARFLKLTLSGGRKVAVNIDQIVTILPSAVGTGSIISTTEPSTETQDCAVYVEESFDQITNALPV